MRDRSDRQDDGDEQRGQWEQVGEKHRHDTQRNHPLEQRIAPYICIADAVAREHRDDASAENRHDDEDDIERRLHAQPFGDWNQPKRSEMRRQFGGRHRGKEHDEENVVPIAALGKRRPDTELNRQRKSGIHRRCRDCIGCEDENTPGEPERCERGERNASWRRSIRPVAHGGEQEASHHREREAKDHFVRVP